MLMGIPFRLLINFFVHSGTSSPSAVIIFVLCISTGGTISGVMKSNFADGTKIYIALYVIYKYTNTDRSTSVVYWSLFTHKK